jgi:hypothetical protein
MLTKTIGTSTVLTMSGTAQTVNPVTNEIGTYNGLLYQRLPAVKVRIATNTQPAFVTFGVVATAGTGVLIPANTSEHFKLDAGTLTNYVSVLQAGTGGIISITPVA